jgi:DNA-binding MarR family transcriptional regulator
MTTEDWRNPALGACLCSHVRRTSRAISAFYDGFLESEGLTVTQYAILVTIARANEGIQRTALAAKLGMERTTLTRNLSPLEREGLIAAKAGTDKRARMIAVTPQGLRKLRRSYGQWLEAQKKFLEGFGPANVAKWKDLMERAIRATGKPRKASE